MGSDMSLQDYIAVKEKYAKYLPHSAGRYAAKRFRKAQCPIVERLCNSLMMHGRNNGKKQWSMRSSTLAPGKTAPGLDVLEQSEGRQAAFRNIKSIAECLSDELINAARPILVLSSL